MLNNVVTSALLVEECLLLCSENLCRKHAQYITIYTQKKIACSLSVILIRKRVCLIEYCIICLQMTLCSFI